MTWLVGIDEAGYGPNLGPLVIGASAWRLPDGASTSSDLYDMLSAAITREPDGERVAVADSKRLYKPGSGLALLERGVLGAGDSVGCWSALVQCLEADPQLHRTRLPWHEGFDPPLPTDAMAEDIQAARNKISLACEQTGVCAPLLRARLVFPAEFNSLVEQHGTKGAALSHVSIGLLRNLFDLLDEDVFCTLDKHGGRNRYGALLQHHFHEAWVDIHEESRAISRYTMTPVDRRMQVEFKTGGESFLPTALASMTAKYLREIAMKALNRFWQQQVPGLRATAGYPVDAKRFRAEIGPALEELKMEPRVLWRNR